MIHEVRPVPIPLYFPNRISGLENLPPVLATTLPLRIQSQVTTDFAKTKELSTPDATGLAAEAIVSLYARSPVLQLIQRVEESSKNLTESNRSLRGQVDESERRIINFIFSAQQGIFDRFIDLSPTKPEGGAAFATFIDSPKGRALLNKTINEILKGDIQPFGIPLTNFQTPGTLFDDINRHLGILRKGATIKEMINSGEWKKEKDDRDYGIIVPVEGIEGVSVRVTCGFPDKEVNQKYANDDKALSQTGVATDIWFSPRVLRQIAIGIPTF